MQYRVSMIDNNANVTPLQDSADELQVMQILTGNMDYNRQRNDPNTFVITPIKGE